MPTSKSNLIQVPVNADTFNLTGDLGTMAESTCSIVPVTNQAAGDTVATSRAAAGFAVSDARPLFIYNTTTKTIQVKDSSGWRDMNGPLGLVARVSSAATLSALTGTQVVTDYVSCLQVLNRWYLVTYECDLQCLGAASLAVGFSFVKHLTDTTTTAGTALGIASTVNYTAPQAGNGRTVLSQRRYQAAATETTNVKILAQRLTGANTYDMSNRFLSVQDLGANF